MYRFHLLDNFCRSANLKLVLKNSKINRIIFAVLKNKNNMNNMNNMNKNEKIPQEILHFINTIKNFHIIFLLLMAVIKMYKLKTLHLIL